MSVMATEKSQKPSVAAPCRARLFEKRKGLRPAMSSSYCLPQDFRLIPRYVTSGRSFVFGHHAPLILLFLLCSFSRAIAADISLSWGPSVSPNITGYNVYLGNSSRTYGTPISVGNQTAYTVSGLSSGAYYFAVTAIDVNGSESEFSNEISQVIGSSGPDCDLNGDGSVNVLDLQLMANAILGLSPALASYDLNGNGVVNVMDLQFLANVVLGFRSCQ